MSTKTHDGSTSMSPGSAPVGNTYHDIMKSVSIGISESGNGDHREKDKALKGRGSIAMLAGVGAGFRRSGKGVKA